MRLRYCIAAPIIICAAGAIAEIAGIGQTAATYSVYGLCVITMLAMLHSEPRVRPSWLSAWRDRHQ
ncbi:MAG TPA: hypothetical protein VGC05_08830 [Mycobacterium sp.]